MTTSRSKSSYGFRSLGSNASFSAHHDTEVEYTLIKSLVEAYSQQCMPVTRNNIPLRADKWSPLAVDCSKRSHHDDHYQQHPNYRLDLGNAMTSQPPPPWGSRSLWPGIEEPRDGETRRVETGSARRVRPWTSMGNGDNRLSARTGRISRPSSPIRNTFQRHSGACEEKVLPVWTPDLKDGIVFSHRLPSTSSCCSYTSVGDPDPKNANNTTPTRLHKRKPIASVQDSPVPVPRSTTPTPPKRNLPPRDRPPKSARSLRTSSTKMAEQLRPKTAAGDVMGRRPHVRKVKSLSETQNRGDPFLANERDANRIEDDNNIREGSTRMTQDQQVLSLNVFLPREMGQMQDLQSSSSKPTGNSSSSSEIQVLDAPGKTYPTADDVRSCSGLNDDLNGKTVFRTCVSCPRLRGVPGKETRGSVSNKQNCKKWIHCELFGPELCSDCRLERDRFSNERLVQRPRDEFLMPLLSLRGRKPAVTP